MKLRSKIKLIIIDLDLFLEEVVHFVAWFVGLAWLFKIFIVMMMCLA